MDPGRLEGLIPLAGGVYAYWLYVRASRSKDAAQQAWKQRFGRLILIAAPISMLFGAVQLWFGRR